MSADHVKESLKSAHRIDLGIIGLGVLVFILSLFPYYKASVDIAGFSYSESANAWHGFFGWFAALVALVVAVIVALHLLGVRLPFPVRLATVGGFGVAAVCIFFALFIIPGGDCQGVQACEDAIDFGHGFAYWLSAIVVIGALVLSVTRMSADE